MARDLAIVTGASAGIGEAFARRLAADDHDLIVIARRADRLRALANELHSQHSVDVEPLVADLGTETGIAALERAAAADRLSLLVNNAGFGGYKPFTQLDAGTMEELLGIHVRAVARATHAALLGMIERGRGAVVTIASMLAFSGAFQNEMLPKRVTYAASKAWQVAFTQLLAGELEGTGVRALVVCPGVVKTEFHEVQGMDMSALPRMSSEDVVQASLAALANGEVVSCPAVDDVSRWDELAGAQQNLFQLQFGAGLAPRYRDGS